MATVQSFSDVVLKKRRSAARSISGVNFDLQKKNFFFLIYISIARETRRDFQNINF